VKTRVRAWGERWRLSKSALDQPRPSPPYFHERDTNPPSHTRRMPAHPDNRWATPEFHPRSASPHPAPPGSRKASRADPVAAAFRPCTRAVGAGTPAPFRVFIYPPPRALPAPSPSPGRGSSSVFSPPPHSTNPHAPWRAMPCNNRNELCGNNSIT
jgi:hypothetical protein